MENCYTWLYIRDDFKHKYYYSTIWFDLAVTSGRLNDWIASLVAVLALEIPLIRVLSLNVDFYAPLLQSKVIAVGALYPFVMDFGHVPRHGLLVDSREIALAASVALHACLTIQ